MKNKFSIAMSLAVILAMLVTSLALADNVVNDVTVGGTDTFTAPGSTTVGYKINTAAAGDPQSGCNASDGSPATITLSLPAGVTASTTSLTFTACNAFQYVTFSSSTPGSYAINVSSISDSGAGSYNNQANFTLHVLALPDSTPPVITPNVSGTLGNNGWYVSDVAVSWSVVDNESAISSSSGCGSTTINSDTAGVTLTCTATSAGGTNSQSVTIKRDATAPSITDNSPTAGPNGSNGWYISAVTNQFSANGAISGLADPSKASFTVSSGSAEGSAVKVNSGSVSDNAGNTNAGIDSAAFMIDLSDPSVACTTPAPAFLLNQAGAQVTASVTDAISGPASPTASATADTSTVGSKTTNVTGYDNAGRSKTVGCPYSVSYNFGGFFQPVDNLPAMNSAKAGQAIPLKWRLTDANGAPVLSLTSVTVTVASLSCSLGTTIDQIEEYATGSSGLQNLGDGYYQFNWKTPTSYANSCKMMNLSLGDGVPHTAQFQFKK